MNFVRVLYSDLTFEFLADEVRRALTEGNRCDLFRSHAYHFTLGQVATSFLADLGVSRIIQVDRQEIIRDGVACKSWNKLYLLREAIRMLGSVVYMDWDVTIGSNFRWGAFRHHLNAKKTAATGIQIPVVMYINERFWWRPVTICHDQDSKENYLQRGFTSTRTGFCGCFMHLTDEKLVNDFMTDFDELETEFGHQIGDEQAITYSLEKRRGLLTLGRMWESYEPMVIQNHRSPFSRMGMMKEHSALNHM